MITEDQLEQLCLEWYQTIGYDYIRGSDIASGEVAAEQAEKGVVAELRANYHNEV